MCDSDMPPFLASITTYTEGRKDHMCQRETQNPHPGIPLACFTLPKIAHAHYDSPLSLSLCYFLKLLHTLSLFNSYI
jgi:hypothetical protein